jgi:hypothetical protein
MDLFSEMLERTGQEVNPQVCAKFFIGFRLLLYCDEVHDFCEERSKLSKTNQKQFSILRFNQCIEDVNFWYNRNFPPPLDKLKPYIDHLKTTDFFVPNDETTDGVSNFLRLFLNLENLEKHQTAFLPMFKAIISKNYNISRLNDPSVITEIIRVSKFRTNFSTRADQGITSHDIAQKIALWIQYNIFNIKSMAIANILGCVYNYNIYDSIKFVRATVHKKVEGTGLLDINIDATQSGTALIPFYNTVFADYIANKCEDNAKESNIRFFKNLSNDYDASNDDKLTKTLLTNLQKDNLLIDQREELFPKSGTQIRLNFAGVPIIEYMFNKNQTDPHGGPSSVALNLAQYFAFNFGGFGRVGKSTSVATLSQEMENQFIQGPHNVENIKKQVIQVAFKTMGDFLQIISFIQNASSFPDNMFCFVTADLLCGKIASILTPYVIAELNIKDNFAGISMFLSENQITQIESTSDNEKIIQFQIVNSDANEFDRMLDDLIEPSEETLESGLSEAVIIDSASTAPLVGSSLYDEVDELDDQASPQGGNRKLNKVKKNKKTKKKKFKKSKPRKHYKTRKHFKSKKTRKHKNS